MKDSDPPGCPRCERPLRKLGQAVTPGTEPDDVNHVAQVRYRCDHCRMRWLDAMDGTQLTCDGAAKKRDTR